MQLTNFLKNVFENNNKRNTHKYNIKPMFMKVE